MYKWFPIILLILLPVCFVTGVVIGSSASTQYWLGYSMTEHPFLLFESISAWNSCDLYLVSFTFVPDPNYRIPLYADNWELISPLTHRYTDTDGYVREFNRTEVWMCRNQTYDLIWGAESELNSNESEITRKPIDVLMRPVESEYILYNNGTIAFANGTRDTSANATEVIIKFKPSYKYGTYTGWRYI
jgi:hypothetical protein